MIKSVTDCGDDLEVILEVKSEDVTSDGIISHHTYSVFKSPVGVIVSHISGTIKFNSDGSIIDPTIAEDVRACVALYKVIFNSNGDNSL